MNIEKDWLVDLYTSWLRDRSSEELLEGGWKALSFPFLDRHNDHIQLFVRDGLDGVKITDDGQTIRDLKQTGCEMKGRTRRRLIAEKILRNRGLDPAILDTGEISATAVNGDFPNKLHAVILSALALDGLASVSPPTAASTFKEGVAEWIVSVNPKVRAGVKFTGASKLVHEFDFLVEAKGFDRPKVVHALPDPDRIHVQSLAYEVLDTRAVMNGNTPDFYAVLNAPVSRNRKQYLALLSQEITPFRWSERESYAKYFM